MATMAEYYARLRQEAESLRQKHPSGCLYITSLAVSWDHTHRSGSVVEVDIRNAARCICAGTHRESTDKEIADFKADAESFRASHTYRAALSVQEKTKDQPKITVEVQA